MLRQITLFITLNLLYRIQKICFETAILPTGINDFLKLGSNIDVITSNIMNIANECKNHGIKDIFISSLTINNRLPSDFIHVANNALKLSFLNYGFFFIE